MQDGTEHFAFDLRKIFQLNQSGAKEKTSIEKIANRGLENPLGFEPHLLKVSLQSIARLLLDHRTDIGCSQPRIAEGKSFCGAFEHLNHTIGRLMRQEKQPQGRTALASRAEGRSHDIINHLFAERSGVGEKSIEAAGF